MFQSGLVMQLDDLFDLWKKDSEIDRSELGEASAKIPQLHYKYYKLYSQERLKLRKLEADYKVLYKNKWSYFQGIMSEEDLDERGWEPNPLKILKSDLNTYIDSDTDIIKQTSKMDYQKEKINFLENIIKSINNRMYSMNYKYLFWQFDFPVYLYTSLALAIAAPAIVRIGPAEIAFTRILYLPKSTLRYLTLISKAALATPITL